MSCSGLHCAGCGGGSAAPVVILAALEGFEWVAAHLLEVAAVSAACGALAFAAVAALMKWANRRDTRRLAGRPLLIVRAGAMPAEAPAERPCLVSGDLHLHFHNPLAAEQAGVIQQALNERKQP